MSVKELSSCWTTWFVCGMIRDVFTFLSLKSYIDKQLLLWLLVNFRQNFRGWVDEIYLPSPIAPKREGPLENETYPSSSHWPTLTLVILRSYLVFRVCLDLVSLLWLVSKQCFTLRCPINYYASSGISPLTNLELPKLHPGLMDRYPVSARKGLLST